MGEEIRFWKLSSKEKKRIFFNEPYEGKIILQGGYLALDHVSQVHRRTLHF